LPQDRDQLKTGFVERLRLARTEAIRKTIGRRHREHRALAAPSLRARSSAMCSKVCASSQASRSDCRYNARDPDRT
jgi:hypothetical protein